MTTMRRGLLYWARLDKRRPALVVSSNRFNERSAYVTIVPGTTRLRPMITHVPLSVGEGGITRATMLLSEHVQEVHTSDVEPEPIGPPIPKHRLREVESALRLYLDLEETPDS
jgi:mRNA-degrading endonuclease toxin of MazEF toxin-antitoxin module